jgi:hypothetical protein
MIPVSLPPIALPAQTAVPPALLAALQSGATLRALVAGTVGDSMLRLLLPGGSLDLPAKIPLPAGTPVEVSVKGTPAQPQITIRPLADAAPSGRTASPVLPGATAAPLAAPPSASPLPAHRTPAAAAEALLQTAAAGIVRQAAARQGGLAPLFADLEVALARPGSPLPAPVREAALQLLGLRLTPSASGTTLTADVKAAVTRAGSEGSTPAAGQPQAATPVTLRPALQALQTALLAWLGAEGESVPAASRPSTGSAQPQPSQTPASAQNNAPPPPHRNGPTVPQPPAQATLPDLAPPRELAAHLLKETDAALARQTLLQIASLPEEPASAARSDPAGKAVLEIPLATPQGTAIVQMRIERDAPQGAAPEGAPVWRVEFSVDVEPIGPVHSRIAIAGERANVTIRAERAESASLLAEGLPLLEAGLRDAALEPGELRCSKGAPAAQTAAPGLFVDRAS